MLCLPKDIPEFIEVDLAGLNVGDSVHLSELKLPEGVSSVELAKGEGHDVAVVSIHGKKGGADESEAAEGEEGKKEEPAKAEGTEKKAEK